MQDGWLAVFSGIGAFEGRSSVVTWLFSIVLNRARTRASREGRLVGLPALMEGTSRRGRAVDVSEFKPDGHWVEEHPACGTRSTPNVSSPAGSCGTT